jgi:O-antigen/teichoic acid export membrane protein
MVASMAMLRGLLIAVSQWIAVVVLEMGLTGLVWATFVGHLLASLIFLFAFRSELTWWVSWVELKKALKLGLPSIPTAGFVNIYRYADRIILERFVSVEMIGIYFLAQKLGDLFKLAMDVFIQAWTPVFFKEAKEPGGGKALADGAVLQLILFGGIALAISLAGEVYVSRFFNIAFHEAVWLVPFALVAQLLKGAYTFPHLGIWLSKKSYWFPVITVIPMALSVSLNFWAIPIWGVYGAAVVMVAGFFVHMLLTYLIGQRLFHIPYRYMSMSAALMLAALCIAVSSVWLEDMTLWSRSAIGVAVYALGAFALWRMTTRSKDKVGRES